jgi:hypothetical protein
MFSYYLKKSFFDHEPGIDLVNIHYTWTPIGQLPNWEAHRETRAMPRGGVFLRGLGGTTVDDSGHYTETSVETIQLPDDGVRRKVIRLPNEIQDPTTGKYTDHYALHHYFEILRGGKQEQSPLFTEEIVSREIEFVDYPGTLGGVCIYWSICDLDAPQYQPTEDPNFIARYGEDSPYRSLKLYGQENKDDFYRTRSEMLDALPLPRRFVGKIRGPKGAQVHQSWHVGNKWQPDPKARWEQYWGYAVHVL